MDCPDKAFVDQFVQGALQADEISRFEAHIDGCSRCLVLVSETAGREDSKDPAQAARQDSLWVHLVAAFARTSDSSPTYEPRPVRDRFGPYRVVGVLGRGAMGVVHSAVHDETGLPVAVKTVGTPSSRSLVAIRHEIEFLKRTQHQGVVQIFADGVIDGDPWYAMELLDGMTLEALHRSLWKRQAVAVARAAQGGAAPGFAPTADAERLVEVVSIFARLCGPLSFIHRAGIVHCDLKPANVWVRRDSRPVLMDFGLLSRAGGAIGRETLETGGLRGTLSYLAPEIIRGRIADARADLYSLGCMLYESVTGRPPFVAASARDLLQAHLYEEPRPPSALVEGLPPVLDDLLGNLLAKRPERRLGGADMVEEILSDLLPEGSRSASPAPAPYLFRPRMVGRDAVLEQLQGLRREVMGGRGRLVLLGGESGIGKTFLASELARLAARGGFQVVTGECVPLAATHSSQQLSSTALEPFRGLLQRAADRCRGGPEIVGQLFSSPRTIRLLVRYEPALAYLVDDDQVEIPALPPPAERDRALEAMREVLSGMAMSMPLLLVIDDIQWADDLSLAFFEAINEEFLASTPVLIVALYRTEEVSGAIARLQGAPHVRAIELERLDDGALEVMVGDLLSRSPPQALVRALALHSEGNPFFVAEYLRAAASEGLLVQGIDGWRVADRPGAPRAFDDLAFPRSLHNLLERRLQLLSEGAQRLVEGAAVLGREFQLSMLATVCGVTPAEMGPWVDEMVGRQLIERSRDAGLRFAHDKIRELAYDRIAAERRRGLHLAAGTGLEASSAGQPETAVRYAELAYHFRNGSVPVRAIDYFEKAADHALRSSANADAVRLFREAMDTSAAHSIPVPPSRRALWARRIGDALQALGDLLGQPHAPARVPHAPRPPRAEDRRRAGPRRPPPARRAGGAPRGAAPLDSRRARSRARRCSRRRARTTA